MRHLQVVIHFLGRAVYSRKHLRDPVGGPLVNALFILTGDFEELKVVAAIDTFLRDLWDGSGKGYYSKSKFKLSFC